MGSILKAKDVLGDLHNEILRLLSVASGQAPKLVCVSIGDDEGTRSYLASIKRVLTDGYGISIEVITMNRDSSEEELIDVIEKLNFDISVSGIMLMRPTPKHINLANVQSHISPAKDVDGVNPSNKCRFWNGDDSVFVSCTAEAALYTLHSMVDDIKAMDVVVVGRSAEVGRPIAELLLRNDATVTVCHSVTNDLSEHLKQADAVISCVGKAHLIDGSMLKEGAYVVDVGMSMLNGILVGDVDIDTAIQKATYVTPAIGGVGAITTHILALHTIQAALAQQ